MERKYLGLDVGPFLAAFLGERRPDLLAHCHVFPPERFEFDGVPVVAVALVHEALVALAAGVGGLGGEVLALDLTPVRASSTCCHELRVISGRPSAR